MRVACEFPKLARTQVTLKTAAKKWVYAAVASDSPWLKVLTPQTSGAQQANIALEIDPQLGTGILLEGKLRVTANGGKVITVPVSADVHGAPRRRHAKDGSAPARDAIVVGVPIASGGLAKAALAMALAFLLLRLLLVPFVDLGGQGQAMADAAVKLGVKPSVDGPLETAAGWLSCRGTGSFSAVRRLFQ